ncbi:hypothetical protein P8C59_006494 [Phyllachora maydis]|uniref:Uncharacterized protein n=1 Tax=Phyllachora maydis TaxID=1825666 RepID=A0AAD9I6Y9_9PEZI|nr:hypothetical protein P8C59_006494 [Phyllachora maydis]
MFANDCLAGSPDYHGALAVTLTSFSTPLLYPCVFRAMFMCKLLPAHVRDLRTRDAAGNPQWPVILKTAKGRADFDHDLAWILDKLCRDEAHTSADFRTTYYADHTTIASLLADVVEPISAVWCCRRWAGLAWNTTGGGGGGSGGSTGSRAALDVVAFGYVLLPERPKTAGDMLAKKTRADGGFGARTILTPDTSPACRAYTAPTTEDDAGGRGGGFGRSIFPPSTTPSRRAHAAPAMEADAGFRGSVLGGSIFTPIPTPSRRANAVPASDTDTTSGTIYALDNDADECAGCDADFGPLAASAGLSWGYTASALLMGLQSAVVRDVLNASREILMQYSTPGKGKGRLNKEKLKSATKAAQELADKALADDRADT